MDWSTNKFSFIRRLWESRVGGNPNSGVTYQQPQNQQTSISPKHAHKNSSSDERSVLKSIKTALFKTPSSRKCSNEDCSTTERRRKQFKTKDDEISHRKLRLRSKTTPSFIVQSIGNHEVQESNVKMSQADDEMIVKDGRLYPKYVRQTSQKSARYEGKFIKLQSFWTMQEKGARKNEDVNNKCSVCRKKLKLENFEHKGKLFCEDCYGKQFVKICAKCSVEVSGPIIIAGTHNFHPECFQCKCCKLCISDGDLYMLVLTLDDKYLSLFCHICFHDLMFKQNQNENVSKTMLDCYLVLVTDFYPKNDFTDDEFSSEADTSSNGSIAFGIMVGQNNSRLRKSAANEKQFLIRFTRKNMESGLKPNDVFLQVNGLKVEQNVLDLIDRLSDDSKNPLKMTIQRKTQLPEAIVSSNSFCICAHTPKPSSVLLDLAIQEEALLQTSYEEEKIENFQDDLQDQSESSTTTEEEFIIPDEPLFNPEDTKIPDLGVEIEIEVENDPTSSITQDDFPITASASVDIPRRKKKSRRRLALPILHKNESEEEELAEIEAMSELSDDRAKTQIVRRCQSLKVDAGMRALIKKNRQSATESVVSEEMSSNFASALPNQSSDNSDLIRSESMRQFGNTFRSHRVFRPCDLILGEALGKGFFGQAIKVTHRETGEVMVLKELNSLDPETETSFLKEVKVMRNLSHPNVLRFIGVLYKEKKLNIISEFVECGTLTSVLGDMEKELSWKNRIMMARDITCGMSYLHSMSIVHRDLNTTNCFVKENGTVVVADFGLARVISHEPTRFRRKRYTIVGNPYWMAPEMVFSKPYSELVDVFAFGIICCEIIGRIQADPDFLPRSHNFGLAVKAFYNKFCTDKVPPFLFAIAVKASSYDPNDRPSFQILEGWFRVLAMKGDIPTFPEPPNLTICIKEIYKEHNIELPTELYSLPIIESR